MRNKQRPFCWGGLVLCIAGCAAGRPYPAPPQQLVEIGQVQAEGDAAADAPANGVPIGAPRHVLVLSGGGMNGAYSAGILKGWTDSGARPQFDIVTGISTGALIAPLAFLGPEHDAKLERLYTSVRQESILRPRLLWIDSVTSSAPLEQQITTGATPEILRQIAEAHRSGRRLYVGTTNLDTKPLVVWDMGAIAARDTPDSARLFRQVLLASCSVPGLLPPVPIDVEIDGRRFTELHVDGGVASTVFLQPAMMGLTGPAPSLQEVNPLSIHVLIAGKLHQHAAPTKRELLAIAGESLNAVLQAKLESEVTQLFLLARYANADFHLSAIPQNYGLGYHTMLFDPNVMRGLFDDGYRRGKDGTAWQSIPPGLEIERHATPRSGDRFTTVNVTLEPANWMPEGICVN